MKLLQHRCHCFLHQGLSESIAIRKLYAPKPPDHCPPSNISLHHPPVCLFFFFQVCCTRGGKDRIYHLSAFGSPELRDAGQHKIIIHRHEITKPPGDPTTKFFLYSPQPPTPLKRMEHVWRRGEGVTVERSGSGGVGGRGDSIS